MGTVFLILLFCLVGFVSGQVKSVAIKPSTLNAGQTPSLLVSFVTTSALTNPDTITVSVAQQQPAANAPIFAATKFAGGNPCRFSVPSGFLATAAITAPEPITPVVDGKSVVLTLPATNTIPAGTVVQFTIPEYCMMVNPTVGTIVWLQVATSKEAAPSPAVPYATSAGLRVTNFAPSSLAGGGVPLSVAYTMISTYDLVAGDTISFHVYDPNVAFFADQPAGTALGTLRNCTLTGQSTATAAAIRSSLLVTLSGPACLLPKQTPFTVNIVAPFTAQLTAGSANGILIATNREPSSQPFFFSVSTNPATAATISSVTPSTTVAGQVPATVSMVIRLTTALVAGDIISIAVVPQWMFLPGVAATVMTDQATCAVALTYANVIPRNDISLTLPAAACTLGANTPITLTFSSALQPNPAPNTTITFAIVTTKDTLMATNLFGYNTTSSCGLPNYSPGTVSDIKAMSASARAELASNIGFLAWNNSYSLSCPTTSSQVTFVKIPSSAFPVLVSRPGTLPITVTQWGYTNTTPMEAVAVSYPPTAASLGALGVNPAIPLGYSLMWVLKVDVFSNIGNYFALCDQCTPLQFVVTEPTALQTSVVMYFEDAGTNGVQLQTLPNATFFRSAPNQLTVQARHNSVFVGFGQTVAGSPLPSPSPIPGGSDAAWVGFVAFAILPLLCCCFLAYWLWNRRRRVPCCAMQCHQPMCMPGPCCMPPPFPAPVPMHAYHGSPCPTNATSMAMPYFG